MRAPKPLQCHSQSVQMSSQTSVRHVAWVWTRMFLCSLHDGHNLTYWPSTGRQSFSQPSLSGGLSDSDTCTADSTLKKHLRLMRGFYEPTTMDCRYTQIQDGCIIFKEICTWSVQMMRSILRWLKVKSRSVLSFLYVLRSVSRLLDLITWKGSKLLKKPVRVNFKSALCLVDICIMSQCCAFVIHCSLVSEVPTEKAMD